jgi:hypothetical protein
MWLVDGKAGILDGDKEKNGNFLKFWLSEFDVKWVVLYFAPFSRFMDQYVLRVYVSDDDHCEDDYNDDSNWKCL